MVKAIRFYETGGPEVLRWEEIALPKPAPGEVRVRQRACGLNFIDIYHRTGLYKTKLPSGLGMEASGVIEELGEGVTGFAPGDRVGYVMMLGAIAEAVNMPAGRLIKLPESVSDEIAAAAMLKGMTAEYLLRRTYPLAPGETILFYAAAGAVGALACQWARHLGAIVIGVVGSADKEALARRNGCAHVLVLGRDDIPKHVRDITNGAGVSVAYDSVGRDTVQASLDSLRRRGLLVSFGNSSGPVTGFDLAALAKGSCYVTRPGLAHYIGSRGELEASAKALFDVLASGAVSVEIHQRYAMRDTALAQRDLESRKTVGASVLIP